MKGAGERGRNRFGTQTKRRENEAVGRDETCILGEKISFIMVKKIVSLIFNPLVVF